MKLGIIIEIEEIIDIGASWLFDLKKKKKEKREIKKRIFE